MTNQQKPKPHAGGLGLQEQDLKSFNEISIAQNPKISKSLLINPQEFYPAYQTILVKAAERYSQVLPIKSDSFTKLIGKVRDERLTESLEILEQQGFTGDLALFFMAIAQEVVA